MSGPSTVLQIHANMDPELVFHYDWCQSNPPNDARKTNDKNLEYLSLR